MHSLLAATTGDVTKAGKAIGLALGVGLGALGAGIGIGNIFASMIQSVARQPELRGELHGHPVARLRADRGRRVLRPARLDPGVRPRLMLAANALISVTPGLMIWTIVCFLITLFVLKRYAFGPIQKMLDDAARADPPLDRGGRQRARGGAQAARGAQARSCRRRAARRSRSSPRRARRASRWSSACARRPRPSGSAGSRRRAARSRRRRRARSSRSAPRSPT